MFWLGFLVGFALGGLSLAAFLAVILQIPREDDSRWWR
jgi:orotate phosphoribosyltransferase